MFFTFDCVVVNVETWLGKFEGERPNCFVVHDVMRFAQNAGEVSELEIW